MRESYKAVSTLVSKGESDTKMVVSTVITKVWFKQLY